VCDIGCRRAVTVYVAGSVGGGECMVMCRNTRKVNRWSAATLVAGGIIYGAAQLQQLQREPL
jgi:hypothetical protein